MDHVCQYCGSTFSRKSAKKKHCSDSCRDKDRYQRDIQYRAVKKQRASAWFKANYDHVREAQRLYYQTHYPEFAAKNFARSGRILDADLVARVLAEDNYTCQYCGQRGGKLTIDHKMPVSRNGSDERDNLCTACHRCNCRKGAKTVEEFTAYLSLC